MRLTINTTEVSAALRAAQGQLENLGPVFVGIGEHMQRRIDDQFRYERDPYGAEWAPLSAATIEAKRRKNKILKRLQRFGIMRATVSYNANNQRVIVGFATVYARFHQTGTKRMVKRLLLPDRGLPAQDEAAIVAIVEAHLAV